MRRFVPIALLVLACTACDKDKSDTSSADSKLLGERLINEHGEGLLAEPVLVVYDDGFIVGRGTVDPEFGDKVDKLGLSPTGGLWAATSPLDTSEYYSQEGVEFGVTRSPEKLVVVDSTSSLTIRLLFGQPGIRALRACEEVKMDRVCKVDGELRARLDDIPANGAMLTDRSGGQLARGELKRGWAVFADAPEVGDDTRLELFLEDGVHCSLSKWLVDPRDSCAM